VGELSESRNEIEVNYLTPEGVGLPDPSEGLPHRVAAPSSTGLNSGGSRRISHPLSRILSVAFKSLSATSPVSIPYWSDSSLKREGLLAITL